MSEVTALIEEIKSKGLLRAGDKLEELYAVTARIQAESVEIIAERDALQAKLAEMEKQEPVAYVMGEETIADFKSGYEFFAVRDAEHEEKMESIPLFTRPAPAVSLAELLPPEASQHSDPRNRNEFYHEIECSA